MKNGMKIEVLVRWSEMRYESTDKQENYVKRILEGEEEGPKPVIHYEFSPMVLDILDIARFNRSNHQDFTTVRMVDGDAYVIKFPYNDFIQFYIELTGKTITSALPKDFDKDAAMTASMNKGVDGVEDDESDDIDDLNL
jgi:hypothetical protein